MDRTVAEMSQRRAVKVINRIKELNLTNKEVATAAGVAERSIYRWLSRQQEPKLNLRQVAGLCTKLKWSVQELAEAYYSPDDSPNAAESDGEYLN